MNKKILFSSLALNLFLAGLIAGHALGTLHRPNRLVDREEKLIANLSKEKREEAHEVLRYLRQLREDNVIKSKTTLREIEELALADKFDEEKFLQKLTELSQSMTKVKSESDQIVTKFLAKLNKEERQQLIESFKEMHERGGPRGYGLLKVAVQKN